MASEAGALPVAPELVLYKGRLQPGKMFVADLKQGRIISDEELKLSICGAAPYREWLDTHQLDLGQLPPQKAAPPFVNPANLFTRQQLFGITSEELQRVLGPMASSGKETIGSMGADTPLAVLSLHSQHISHYFKQLFAQVSNPPIDPIREKMVMSLASWIGGSRNILEEKPAAAKSFHCLTPSSQMKPSRVYALSITQTM